MPNDRFPNAGRILAGSPIGSFQRGFATVGVAEARPLAPVQQQEAAQRTAPGPHETNRQVSELRQHVMAAEVQNMQLSNLVMRIEELLGELTGGGESIGSSPGRVVGQRDVVPQPVAPLLVQLAEHTNTREILQDRMGSLLGRLQGAVG